MKTTRKIFILLGKIQFLPIWNAFLRCKPNISYSGNVNQFFWGGSGVGGVEVGTACGPLVEMETIDIHYRDSPFTLKAVYFQTFFPFGRMFCLSLVPLSNHIQLYVSLPLNLCYPNMVASSHMYLLNTWDGASMNCAISVKLFTLFTKLFFTKLFPKLSIK